MSISSMQGRLPFFSLGTSAEYFREKNKFINWTFIYEKYFSVLQLQNESISLAYMLKVLKIQMVAVLARKVWIRELFNVTGKDSCLLDYTVLKWNNPKVTITK